MSRSAARPGRPARGRRVALALVALLVVVAGAALVVPSLRGSDPQPQVVAVAEVNDEAHPVAAPKKRAKPPWPGYAPPSARPLKRKKESVYDAVAATAMKKAENVPSYPPDGRHGRRIVYSKALMHVWIVDDNDRVVRHYPVIGRWDRPAKGVYKVYSKSHDTMNTHSHVTFFYMVRFAWGKEDSGTSIGFHNIPRKYQGSEPTWDENEGTPVSKESDMGLPIATGGCVRATDANAKFLYYWSKVGDRVVVLPTST